MPRPTFKPRELLLRVHRYLGLVLVAFITLAGLTGSALVFMDDLDDWLNRDIVTVPVQAQTLPVAQLVAAVERAYPMARVSGYFQEDDPRHAYRFTLARRGAEHLPVNEVWVDPYSGALRGARLAGAARFDRRHLMPALLMLHRSLFLGGRGETLMGCLAFAWLLSSLCGLYLALPRGGSWRKVLQIKFGASAFKQWLDLHRVAGVTTAVVLLGTAFTAAYLATPTAFRTALAPLFHFSAPPLQRIPAATAAAALTPEQASAIAARALPGGTVTGVYLQEGKSAYQVRVRVDGDINSGNGTGRVFVDKRSGAVLARTSYRLTTGGDRLLAWLFPLHSGQAFGLPGRLVILAFGLAPLLLGASGVYIFLHKRRARALQSARAAGRNAARGASQAR